jgi:hypothetical protein
MKRPDYLKEDDDVIFHRMAEAAWRKDIAAKPSGAAGEAATVRLVSAESIAPRAIEWIWPGWIARGRLHILAGQPGAGKTTLALSFAAEISRGGEWPDGSPTNPGTVVIWSGEDDPADTLVPRLIAAGADLRRVHFVQGVREDGRSCAFDPARDMGALEKEALRVGNVALVIIDPVALIATKDSHKNAETRRDLQPLAELCRSTGAAALGVHHLAKGTAGREPQERLVGSIAFAAVARVVMIAAKQPAQEDGPGDRRILMRAKSNIGPDEGGFAYELEQAELAKHPGVFASRVDWGEPVEGCARDVLAEAERPLEVRAPRDDAADFLRNILADGAVEAKTIFAAARNRGIADATLKRAKATLRVVSRRHGFGPGGSSEWALGTADQPIEDQNAHRGPLKTVIHYGERDPLWREETAGEEHVEVEI